METWTKYFKGLLTDTEMEKFKIGEDETEIPKRDILSEAPTKEEIKQSSKTIMVENEKEETQGLMEGEDPTRPAQCGKTPRDGWCPGGLNGPQLILKSRAKYDWEVSPQPG
ncbi:hypothetical protein FQA39_LY16194 [Lamprigera yunnana]|nr:hypothetical protein FQA39_LY16194 [Lamprigera yunnana]